jgi:hypothetical protein
MWLLTILFIFNLSASDLVTTAIESAQAQARKKNRQAAATILKNAIQETANSPKLKSRLQESLNNVGKVFFTDKGQRLFEAAQSSAYDNPDLALGQFREALKLEDDNILVLTNIARVQLAKQDCAGALLTLDRARQLNESASEPAVLELRGLICQRNYEAFREKQKLLPSLDKDQESFVAYLAAQDLMQQKLWRKAFDTLSKVSEEQSQFPETYFYLLKAAAELDRETDRWAEKYIELCTGLTTRTRRRYAYEPRLCANAKEVSDELANKNPEL